VGIASFLSRTSPIKSIQRGTITIAASATTGTATISSVNTGKSVLHLLGWTQTYEQSATSGTHRYPRMFPRIALTDATTVTATRNSSDSAETVTVSYEVIEYY
jgi:hypothetical protein